ncbi:MAG: hypothetical protein PVI97_13280, partial [Candidatus Thiodiazotropha sp.]
SSRPVGSNAGLTDASSSTPDFTPDQIGIYLFQLIVNDGNLDSAPDTFTLQVDPLERIAINLDEPSDELFTNQANITFIGSLNHLAALTINDQLVILDSDLNFSYSVELEEGLNQFTLIARDAVDAEAVLMRNLTLDTSVPEVPDSALIDVSSPDGGVVTISGDVGSAEPFAQVILVNLSTGVEITVNADEDGAFTAQINGDTGDTYTIAVRDAAGNQSDTIQVGKINLPPDPSSVATPLDPTESTSFIDSVSFLYTDSNPIQTGVAQGTIEAKRCAVIRGQVLDKQNDPLPGVTITIKGHPEFGQTISRADGVFDMAVNGGDEYVINYVKQDYLPVQRRVKTRWRNYYRADNVVLIQLDPQVTTIDLASSEPMQVAQGSAVTDSDGTRQATIMIPQGTTASMTLPNGTSQPLTSLDLRATEYTVGENGPESMPGPLPATSGYTYAVELSVDAAIAANAVSVDFSQPVQFYVDNYLNFPVGEVVPVGYLDRDKAAWMPSQNGKIIKIISVDNGLAQITLDSSDSPATQSELDAVGITVQEQAELADTYVTGTELWRVQIEHLTPWDCNWPYGPPDDATGPEKDRDVPDDPVDPCEKSGCIIGAESQTLGERIELVGTPYTLNYRSNRVPGNKVDHIVKIPLSGDSIPGSLVAIDLTIEIAGNTIKQRYPATQNQTVTWVWDGLDAYGREVNGSQIVTITVDYIYPPVYYAASNAFESSFAIAGAADGNGGLRIIAERTSQEIKISRTWEEVVQSAWIVEQAGLGGWSISEHHSYDFIDKTLELGNGTKQNAELIDGGMIATAVGNGISGYSGDGGLAQAASISLPTDIAIAPDGALYFADSGNFRIRKVDQNGIITTVAGTGTAGFSGDGGLATEAQISYVRGIDIAGDTLYIADSGNDRIRKVDAQGIITTLVGDGVGGYSGDGGPAEQARIHYPEDIAVASDGTFYFTDSLNRRIRKVDPSGTITTAVGNGEEGCISSDSTTWWGYFGRDGFVATDTILCHTNGIVIAPDGGFYYSDRGNHRIFKVGVDGRMTVIVGNGDPNTHFDDIAEGVLATDDGIREPLKIALSPTDNSLYLSYAISAIRHVGSDNIINTIAGDYPDPEYTGDNVPAKQAVLGVPLGLAVNADNALYVADYQDSRIRVIKPILPGFSFDDITISSADGQLIYRFDKTGRHISTLNALTGGILTSFGYTDSGLLETITDAFGNVTRIQRNSVGEPIQIIAPDGQVTTLGLDANGYLESVTDQAGQQHHMTYDSDGLMTGYTSPRGHSSSYQYDEIGRLRQDTNAENGGWNLSRTDSDTSFDVTMTSAEGRSTQYHIESLPTHDRLRTITSPAGGVTVHIAKASGEQVTTYPDGTISKAQMGLDPRFGMLAPILTSATSETPSGLISTFTRERTASLGNSLDSQSLETLTDTITSNGRVSTREYNADNNTWTTTSAAGRISSMQINDTGQPILSQITDLDQVSYSYDSRGRLQSLTVGSGVDARNNTLEYYTSGPSAGFMRSITNAEEQTTIFEYDDAGRVNKQILPDTREIGYDYDENGNLASLTPPGRSAHIYRYDGVDQPTQYTPPSISGITTPQTVYTYDRDKKLTQVTRPDGQLVSLNYGATSGYLDSITIPRGTYSYSYNLESGKLDNITAPDGGILSFSYDGSLTTTTHWTGAVAGSIEKSYDNNFLITARSINGSNTVSYQYDDDDLLIQAGSLTINREEQKAGIINGTILGGISTARRYNGFAELESYDASFEANSLFNTVYTRDKLGRISQKVETIAGESTTTVYDYDLAGRLESITEDGTEIAHYQYDSNGNRTHVNGALIAAYDDQDRLLTYGDAAYSYTANG